MDHYGDIHMCVKPKPPLTNGKDMWWQNTKRLSIVLTDNLRGVESMDLFVGVHSQQDVGNVGLGRGGGREEGRERREVEGGETEE